MSRIIHHVARLGPQHAVRKSVATTKVVADTSHLLRTTERVNPNDTASRNVFGREHASACARLLGVAKKLGQVVDLELRERNGETFVHCRARTARRWSR